MQERIHIGFFGCRNVGKSSLVNAITNQEMSVVSNTKGTTTDPVKKAMELLPLGKVLIIDTPGYDDVGELGAKRVETTKKILRNCDIAILVTEADRTLNSIENELVSIFKERKIPYLLVKNKSDLYQDIKGNIDDNIVYTSAINKIGIEELKNTIGNLLKPNEKEKKLVSDLLKPKDIVILVTPIDSAAPKNRLILPQQLAIRDIIDNGAIPIVVRETELEEALNSLNRKPYLVITDSQVFEFVNKIVPKDVYLTSFSILMARYKGFLKQAYNGVLEIDKLKNGSKILISEGCTHHRQCDDIGTVKIPKWLTNYTEKNLKFSWSTGNEFLDPNKLAEFDLIIHCGGCMLNSNELKYRMNLANEKNIPFTNYGIVIAYINGILKRSCEILESDL